MNKRTRWRDLLQGSTYVDHDSAVVTDNEVAGSFHWSTYDTFANPICVFDDPHGPVEPNERWQRLAGLPLVVDNHPVFWHDLIAEGDQGEFRSRLAAATASSIDRIDIDCPLLVAGGSSRWFRLSCNRTTATRTDSSGIVAARWICSAVDIDDLILRQNELERRTIAQHDMLEASVDCIKLISPDGTLLHINRAGREALGLSADSDAHQPWVPLLPTDIHDAARRALEEVRSGRSSRFPGRSERAGHPVQLWDNMLTPVTGPDGSAQAVLCVSREVTAERAALKLLAASQERLAIASRVGGVGVWDYDIRTDVLECDSTWYQIMGLDPAMPIANLEQFRPLIHPDDVDTATEIVGTVATLRAESRDYSLTYRIVRPDGQTRWVRSAACLLEESGDAVRAVGFVVDITETRLSEIALRRRNDELERQSHTLAMQSMQDPLTGIANRRRLDLELARIFAADQDTTFPVCVGLIDVDHFKAYNDRFGHLEGDNALQQIASALSSVTRQSDLVARYGGEEFVVVLTAVRDAATVLNRFHTAVVELGLTQPDSPTGHLTISCGYTVGSTPKDLSPQLMLTLADAALYQAKAHGRNTFWQWHDTTSRQRHG